MVSHVAQLKQGYEFIGFLVPNIVLAIVNSIGSEDNYDTDTIIRRAAIILGIFGLLFFLLGADIVISAASKIQCTKSSSSLDDKDNGIDDHDRRNDVDVDKMELGTNDDVKKELSENDKNDAKTNDQTSKSSVDDDDERNHTTAGTVLLSVMKQCLVPSICYRLILNSILLSFMTLLLGMAGLIAEYVFHLSSTNLWIGTLASPIGGMVPIVMGIFSKEKKGQQQQNTNPRISLKNAYTGTLLFFGCIYYDNIIIIAIF